MKKSGKRFEDFPPSQLYIEDLKEIIGVFENNCEKVEIRTDDYDNVLSSEIDSLVDSLQSKRFDNIYIKAYRPYVTLDLKSYGISAYISEDDLIHHGIIAKVREIVEKRKKKYFSTIPNILSFLPIVGFFVTLCLREWLFSGAFLMLSFLMVGPIVKYQMAYKVIVLTSSKTQKESFFVRRKDELLVALVSALIGALITFLLVKCFGQA